jgi:hypothetical protein
MDVTEPIALHCAWIKLTLLLRGGNVTRFGGASINTVRRGR